MSASKLIKTNARLNKVKVARDNAKKRMDKFLKHKPFIGGDLRKDAAKFPGIKRFSIPNLSDSPANTKQSWKLSEEYKLRLIELMALAKIEGRTQISICETIKKETGIDIKHPAISEFGKTHRKEIGIKISELAADIIRECPLIHKDVRIMRLSKIAENPDSQKMEIMALNNIRAEIDERGDKIADALRQVGGNFNFDFSGLNDDDKNRLTENVRRGLELRVSIPRK